jgi:putative ABC transport system permease protein
MRRWFTISALTRKSLADVFHRRGRTMLVVLGLLLGVFGLTAINITNATLLSAFQYTTDETTLPNIDFSVQSVDPSLAATLASVPNVQTVLIDTSYPTRWHITTPPGHTDMTITGYQDLHQIPFSPFQLRNGAYPSGNEILMESSDTSLQTFAIGDLVTIDTPHGSTQLRVAGTTRTLGLPSPSLTSKATAYMNAATLTQIAGAVPNDIQVKVSDTSNTREIQTRKDIEQVLLAHHVTVLTSTLVTASSSNVSVVNNLFAVMRVLSVIALLLTGFLMTNTIATLMTEQIKYIGIMKALGGTRTVILRSYLLSVNIYGIVGTLLGIVLGTWGSYQLMTFFSRLITFDVGPFQFPSNLIVISVAFGLGIPLLAAIVPLWHGTSVTVRDVLSAYGISSSGSGNQTRQRKLHLTWVPQTVWVGWRSIFRKRGQTILTLLMLAFAGASFLIVQTTKASYDQHFVDASNVYGFDVRFQGNPAPISQITTLIAQLPNVQRIEPLIDQDVTTQWGKFPFTAVVPDTQMYHYQVYQGRWFHGDEPNAMLINDDIVRTTGLHVGDTLTFSTNGHTATWTIIGAVHDPNRGTTDIGIAVTTVTNIDTFMGIPSGDASQFMVRATDHSTAHINQLATNIDNTLSQSGIATTVQTKQQYLNSKQTIFQILSILLYAVVVIVSLVGILGLFSTLTTSVLERRREIGILRAMGASRRQVALVFWSEGALLALFAWLAGVILGIPMAYAFAQYFSTVLTPLSFTLPPLTLGLMLIFICIIASFASIGPALSATRVRVIDSLHYE